MYKIFTEKAAAELRKSLEKYAADTKLQKGISKENGVFEVIMSTEHVDRDGEIVKQDGLDTKNFMKNPVVLFGHNHRDLPIGKITKIRKEGKKTIAEGVFASANANPLAQQVRNLYDEGIIKTVSIGFMVRERDEQKRNILTETELLELSFVPIPSNINAVSLLKNAGIKDFDFKLMDIKDVDDAEEEEKEDDKTEDLDDVEGKEDEETAEGSEEEEKKEVKDDEEEADDDESDDSEEGDDEPDEDDEEKSFSSLNEHETGFRLQVRDAADFQREGFQFINIPGSDPQIKAAVGKLEDGMGIALQSLIFAKSQEWTGELIKAWSKEHLNDVKSKSFDFKYLESMILEGKKAIKEVDDKVDNEVKTADEVRKMSKQAMASISQIVEKGALFYKESRGLDGSDKNKK